MTKTTPWASIDAYIAAAPPDRQPVLAQLRATIRAAAPEAEETISYNMPAFAQHGTLVYFALQKTYIGFYPTGSGIAPFKRSWPPMTRPQAPFTSPSTSPYPWI